MRNLLTLTLLVFGTVAAVPGRADHCRAIHRGGYVAPIKHAVKAVKVIDHYQAYPVYGRSYLESYDDSYKKERLQQQQYNVELLKAVNLLTQRLQQMQAPSQQFDPSKKAEAVPQMPKAEPQSKAAQIVQAKCAQCHTQGNEQGGLALIDKSGNLLDVPCLKVPKLVKDVYEGRMPKGTTIPKVTDQEFAELVKHYGSGKNVGK